MIFKILNGNKIIDFNISKIASTVSPINLKGNNSSQIRGYKNKTPIANGSEIIAKIIHKMNVNIV
jgi:hypothetical protein